MAEIAEKKCFKCGKIKKLEEYNRQSRGIDGRHSYCKECVKEEYHKKRKIKLKVKTKRCGGCEKTKGADKFCRSGMTKDGLQSYCKDCENAFKREKRHKKEVIAEGRSEERGRRHEQKERIRERKLLQKVDKLLLINCPRRALQMANMIGAMDMKLSETKETERQIMAAAATGILQRKEEEEKELMGL